MINTLTTTINIYKATLSFGLEVLFGKGCRYQPTCSQYAKEAIEKHGALKGTALGVKRLLSCHPFASPGLGPT